MPVSVENLLSHVANTFRPSNELQEQDKQRIGGVILQQKLTGKSGAFIFKNRDNYTDFLSSKLPHFEKCRKKQLVLTFLSKHSL